VDAKEGRAAAQRASARVTFSASFDPGDPVLFGDWVRHRRRTLDLTQAALAHSVGCAIDTIKKIETGLRRPSSAMAERLADCLRVSADIRPNFLQGGRTGFIAHLTQEPGADMSQIPARLVPSAGQTNLPSQLTPFIGRKLEIETLTERAQQSRLLTLTGAGGVGKTRLAIEVASGLREAFADGVGLVELASVVSPALVPQTVAGTFKRLEQTGRTHIEGLCAFLRDKQVLLVLDNCEHVIGAVAELAAALLRACPNLHVLTTSREPLRVPGEAVWRVPSLATPDIPTGLSDLASSASLKRLCAYEAVQLFMQSATLAQPEFVLTPENATAVAQICQRLDGIPLALEMAAANVTAMSAEEIAAGLKDQLALLTGGSRTALLRHQTLRATLDWSYALLSPSEQRLLAHLSVFVGGCTLEATEAICDLEHTSEGNSDDGAKRISSVLLALVNKSLVVPIAHAPHASQTRYRLLEVVRQYAAQKLATQSIDAARAVHDRHLTYYLALAEASAPRLHTAQVAQARQRLESDHDNLRAAIDWAFESGDTQAGLRLVAALTEFWDQRSYFQEQRGQLQRALKKSSPDERTSVRAILLNHAGGAAWFDGELEEARQLLDEALSIGLELNDQAIIAESYFHRSLEAHVRGDEAGALAHLDRAMADLERIGDCLHVSYAQIVLASLAEIRGDDNTARALLDTATCALEKLGEHNLQARACYRLARLASREGDIARATTLCKRSLTLILESLCNQDAPSCLIACAGVALIQGDRLMAAQLLGAVARLLDEMGIRVLRGDAAEYERVQAALRAQLDPATLESALTKGKRMTFEQAAEYALAMP